MASVDTPDERDVAMSGGWSTFRVMTEGELATSHETVCPASAEAGRLRTCADCLRCNGQRDHGVVIRVHGTGAGHFRPAQIELLGRRAATTVDREAPTPVT